MAERLLEFSIIPSTTAAVETFEAILKILSRNGFELHTFSRNGRDIRKSDTRVKMSLLNKAFSYALTFFIESPSYVERHGTICFRK